MTDAVIALVTGASRGIGAAVCRRLRRDGFQVMGVSRSPPPPDVCDVHHRVDLGDPREIAAFCEAVVGAAQVRVLVNNAALIVPQPLGAIEDHDLRRQTELNLLAPITLAQAVLPAMRAAGHGRIVSIGSRAALGKAGRSVYSATKAALCGLTRTWALELAPLGITVNLVSPGPVGTELFWDSNPPGSERTRALVAGIPRGRMGTPEDVAAAVAYFAGTESDFVTGQILQVCGGASIGSMAP
jgi:3-oxoacyl-[acyl-carrier protein] reductase